MTVPRSDSIITNSRTNAATWPNSGWLTPSGSGIWAKVIEDDRGRLPAEDPHDLRDLGAGIDLHMPSEIVHSL